MDKKKTFLILGAVLILSIVGLSNLDMNNENSFDVCEEQPTFGLKYENCKDINCVNFYEEIKESVRSDCE